MKELLLINDSGANKITYYHLVLLMASLPFDRFYSHIILISFAIHTLIHLRKKNLQSLLSLKMLVLQSVLVVSLIATIYTINHTGAGTELTLRLPILLFPILFSINEFDLKKYRAKLLLIFSLVCTGVIIYLYADALITIRYYHLPLRALFSVAFTNHNFAEPIDMHATFFSFQLVIALVTLLNILMKGVQGYLKRFYSVCCLVLICGIIQLSSKSILIILFVIINFVVPYCLLTGKSRLKFIIAGLSVSAIVLVGVLAIPSFRQRYLTLLENDLSAKKTLAISDPRLARWHVVTELIKKKPLTGYGSGSEVPLLHNGFYNAKMYDSFMKGLNAHNQYLSFLLKSGIWGLFIYLLTLIYGLKLSIQKKDVVFISFMLLIITVSLSENVLDADKGVMFYSFFFSFFVLCNNKKEKGIHVLQKPDDYLVSVATNALPLTSY